MGCMKLPGTFDLPATLFSGQTFAWTRITEGYLGRVAGNGAILMDAPDNTAGTGHLLCWEGPENEEFWLKYFDCERDYGAVFASLQTDSRVSAAYAAYPGIRLLKQPIWETLCMFILSANNNISRIASLVNRLCEAYGEKKAVGAYSVFLFPSVDRLAAAGEEGLRALGLGYRAPYLLQTARRVQNGYGLSGLPAMGYEKALKALMEFPGVGEKVADCVLLFSCGYDNALPIDTWVLRILRELYGFSGGKASLKAQALHCFGPQAGVVQQFLFHGARMGLYEEVKRGK